MGKPIKRIGIIPNQQKADGLKLAYELKQWFDIRGVEVRLPAIPKKDNVEEGAIWQEQDFYEGLDCIIILGGDGTLLRVARAVDTLNIPILGVNLGHLGFLTELELPDMYSYLEKLLSGEYHIEERMMLESKVIRQGRVLDTSRALNDVVVAKGPLSRIIHLDVYIDDQYFSTLRGDGLIISTPTGSTAYSLSAGGPIVTPLMEMILLTPICSHTFYSRPLVISSDQCIKIVLKSRDEVALTVDGQYGLRLQVDDRIVVYHSSCKTRLIKVRGRHFFEVIRDKLTL